MERLFGVPMGPLSVALTLAVVVALGALAGLAARNRVLLRLGVRNVARRPARSGLIVVGLMLGTAIIASALSTGDTISHTVRASVLRALGHTDELVSVHGAEVPPGTGLEDVTRVTYFDQRVLPEVERTLERTGRVDGVAPAIIEPVPVQHPAGRRNEPRVTLFATDPARMDGFGSIERTGGGAVSLSALAPSEVFLNDEAADELDAERGSILRVFGSGRPAAVTVRDVVRYDGTGSDGPALLLGLGRAQALLGREREIKHVLVSNGAGGVGASNEILRQVNPALGLLGLEADPVKQDGLEAADEQGEVFISVFTTFGSFSVAAGILLIFLIFVMLAAERRSELGIARAVGTRRAHLVEMFVFEGAAYDLGAAAVGAFLGVAVAYVMVEVLAQGFGALGLEIEHSMRLRSVVVAFALGVLLTLVVVGVSAWRVSRLNIVAAVRNLPEPIARRAGRRRTALAVAVVVLGVLATVAGAAGGQAAPFLLGVSLVLLGAVPLARSAGMPERTAYTACGLALVVWWLLPFDALNALAGRELTMDFSIWVLSGLMVVTGATWLVVYNADVLLGLAMSVLGRVRALAPVVKMAMAYPLRGRFRTGITLAMFTLVVFTLVVGATTSGSFLRAFDDVEAFGGGFDVRAEVAPETPIGKASRAVHAEGGLYPGDFPVAADGSFVPTEARQAGTRGYDSYPLRGFDPTFLGTTTYGLATMARGYDSPREVFGAIAPRPNLAVVDALAVPRRANWTFGPPPPLRLTGFYLEDERFDPVQVVARDPQTGSHTTLTVIGVLKDTAPIDMAGIWTSQRTARSAFGERAIPTHHYFKLAPGVDAEDAAGDLEQAFAANGMQAESLAEALRDVTGANYTINWLVLGFMGLGLVIGVAALGVISARSVVERRQQIGVLRSIGFRRRMVQLSFLLESSFIALTAILVGTTLGLIIAFNVVNDAAQEASWDTLAFVVPWAQLAVVFVAVYGAALLTALAPAVRASRVYPAEALRYE